MPVQLRSFAQRVEDLVREFKAVAGANLIIENYNPQARQRGRGRGAARRRRAAAAVLGRAVLPRPGGEPARPQAGDPGGLAAARAAARVRPGARDRARRASAERPMLGLMSALPVLGERFNPMTRQSSEPWVLANELKRDFDVKQVPLIAKSIDPEIKVLLVIHPRDLPDADRVRARPVRAARRQADRVRRSLRLLRPAAEPDARHAAAAAPVPRLPTLFKAWGVEMNPGKVLADVVYASGAGPALHADGADAQPHRVQPRRRRHQPDRDAALRLRRRVRRQAGRGTEGHGAGQELAQLDAGRQHRRHRVGRRGDEGLPARQQGAAARAAADGQVQDRLPGRQAEAEIRQESRRQGRSRA